MAMFHPEDFSHLIRSPEFFPFKQYFIEMKHVLEAGVAACRDHIRREGPSLGADIPELVKNDEKAAQIRRAGNRFLEVEKNPSEALRKYNESICWATPGSQQLAFGYAYRSVLYFNEGEYELSLANVVLAKKSNFPESLMPHLVAREAKCRERIDMGQSKQSTMCSRFEMTTKKNPRIPCIAEGISMRMTDKEGRSLVAVKSFKTGDVILDEKMVMASVNASMKYWSCNYCTAESYYALIPCPRCVSVMFCDEECMKKSLESNHRFECGIVEKLNHISSYGYSYIGPRMFFHGLTLFQDDVQAMMDFCAKHERVVVNPFSWDWTAIDPLREFKIFHMTKVPICELGFDLVLRYHAALYYTVFIDHPPVKALFNTESRRAFMLQCLLDYMRTAFVLTTVKTTNVAHQLHTFGALCNHSCTPNALALSSFGRLKLIVLNPIRPGQTITISYGPLYSEHCDTLRREKLDAMEILCRCDVCDPCTRHSWLICYRKPLRIPRNHFTILDAVVHSEDTNSADKLNALQQFIERHGSVCPHQFLDRIVEMFRQRLTVVFIGETHVRNRQIAMELARR